MYDAPPPIRPNNQWVIPIILGLLIAVIVAIYIYMATDYAYMDPLASLLKMWWMIVGAGVLASIILKLVYSKFL